MSARKYVLPAMVMLGLMALSGTSAAADGGSKRGLDPGQTRGAKVVKAGWWWAANEPPPETGIVAEPQPASPNIPKGALPVGAVGGDPEKVSAIEVSLKAKPGSIVESFKMVLRESKEPGANTNAESAGILACPVTELFWADGQAAAWKNQPTYDCKLAQAKGKRTKKGLWRFDLTAIASGWLAEGVTSSRSVVLVEDVEAPESFQVALDGVKDKGIGLELHASPPVAQGRGSGLVPDSEPTGSIGTGVGAASGSSGLASGGAPSLSGGSAPAPVGDATSPKVDSQPSATEPKVSLAAASVGAVPQWYSGIPRTGYLLFPLALGLAYLIMLAMGPDGRPAPAIGRHGVSRALDRLRQSGRALKAGEAR